MGTKSQMFRVFVEGETISDGRKITPEMIDQCVETFDLKTYTPRINIEHIAGYSPEPPFNGYGDVIALDARDDEFKIAGVTETRRALYAQVDGNAQLVKLGAADQKPFPSVELTGSYAGTGKVGLVGLAFTDTPASIGTERLKFSSRAPGTVFAYGTERADMQFEAAPVDAAGLGATIKAAIAAGFAAFTGGKGEDKPKTEVEKPKPANDNSFDPAAFASTIGETMATAIGAAIKPLADAQAAQARDFAALKAGVERTEAPAFHRPPASGAQVDAKFATDC